MSDTLDALMFDDFGRLSSRSATARNHFSLEEMTMAGVEARPGGTDGTTIELNDDANVRAWARKLDATPEQIREAVEAKGNQAADVELHLKGSHVTTNADQEKRAEMKKDS